MADIFTDPLFREALTQSAAMGRDPLADRMGVQQSPMAMMLQMLMPMVTGTQMIPNFPSPHNMGLQQQQLLMDVVMPQMREAQQFQQTQFAQHIFSTADQIYTAQGGDPSSRTGQLLAGLGRDGLSSLPGGLQVMAQMAMPMFMQSDIGMALMGQDPSSPMYTQTIMQQASTAQRALGGVGLSDTGSRQELMQGAFEQVQSWIKEVFDPSSGMIMEEARGVAVNALVGLAQKFADSIQGEDIQLGGGIAAAARAAQDAFRVSTPEEMHKMLTLYGGGGPIQSMAQLDAIQSDLRRTTAIAGMYNVDPSALGMFGAAANRMSAMGLLGVDDETGRIGAGPSVGSMAARDMMLMQSTFNLTPAEAQQLTLRRVQRMTESTAGQRGMAMATLAGRDFDQYGEDFTAFTDAVAAGDTPLADSIYRRMSIQAYGTMEAAESAFASPEFRREQIRRMDQMRRNPTGHAGDITQSLDSMFQQGLAAEDNRLLGHAFRNEEIGRGRNMLRTVGLDPNRVLEPRELLDAQAEALLTELEQEDSWLAARGRKALEDGNFGNFLETGSMRKHADMVERVYSDVETTKIREALETADPRAAVVMQMADDMHSDRLKREVRSALGKGNVDQALDLIREQDPELLDRYSSALQNAPELAFDRLDRASRLRQISDDEQMGVLTGMAHVGQFIEATAARETRMGALFDEAAGEGASFLERVSVAFAGHENFEQISKSIHDIQNAIDSGTLSTEEGQRLAKSLLSEMGADKSTRHLTKEQRALATQVSETLGDQSMQSAEGRQLALRRIGTDKVNPLVDAVSLIQDEELQAQLTKDLAIVQDDSLGFEDRRNALLRVLQAVPDSDTVSADQADFVRLMAPLSRKFQQIESSAMQHGQRVLDGFNEHMTDSEREEFHAALENRDVGTMINLTRTLMDKEIEFDGKKVRLSELSPSELATLTGDARELFEEAQTFANLEMLTGVVGPGLADTIAGREVEDAERREREESGRAGITPDSAAQQFVTVVEKLSEGVNVFTALVEGFTQQDVEGRAAGKAEHAVTINLALADGEILATVNMDIEGNSSRIVKGD